MLARDAFERRGVSMAIMLRALLASLALMACTLQARAQDPALPLLASIDAASRLWNLEQFRNTGIAGFTQVRVWTEFADNEPGRMVGFFARGDHIEGEMRWYFPNDAGFGMSMASKCTGLRYSGELAGCSAIFEQAPDWKSLYAKLQSLGVGTLPGESMLPAMASSLNSNILVVEILVGEKYRVYHYTNPSPNGTPEERHAAAILELVEQL
jgi:hypothetical protein